MHSMLVEQLAIDPSQQQQSPLPQTAVPDPTVLAYPLTAAGGVVSEL